MKDRKNISLPMLYTELNRGEAHSRCNQNGEPGEYLRYFLYYP